MADPRGLLHTGEHLIIGALQFRVVGLLGQCSGETRQVSLQDFRVAAGLLDQRLDSQIW